MVPAFDPEAFNVNNRVVQPMHRRRLMLAVCTKCDRTVDSDTLEDGVCKDDVIKCTTLCYGLKSAQDSYQNDTLDRIYKDIADERKRQDDENVARREAAEYAACVAEEAAKQERIAAYLKKVGRQLYISGLSPWQAVSKP